MDCSDRFRLEGMCFSFMAKKVANDQWFLSLSCLSVYKTYQFNLGIHFLFSFLSLRISNVCLSCLSAKLVLHLFSWSQVYQCSKQIRTHTHAHMEDNCAVFFCLLRMQDKLLYFFRHRFWLTAFGWRSSSLSLSSLLWAIKHVARWVCVLPLCLWTSFDAH